jgi:hypothetical protein
MLLRMEREPFNIQDAWQGVGELYRWITSLFGAPFALAERLLLLKETRRDILAWLGPVEALARRLLLLKALSLPAPNYLPPKPFAGRLLIAFTDRPLQAINPESEKWRVCFSVMPHGVLRRKRGAQIGAYADPRSPDDFNAFPLARRLEALRRVLENPAPAVARLCRLLAARRDAVSYAFRPYRPRATCAQYALADVQRALDLALNTS